MWAKNFCCCCCCCFACSRPKWDNPGLPEKRFSPWMKAPDCHPEVRCVKTRRTGSRSTIYTNASQPLRALPAFGYEAICLSLKGRSSIGFDIEKSSSPSIQIPAVRKSSPSVCRARSCRRCVQARYTSRFVASKCLQRVDVQLYCLEDRHALRRLDALAN